MNDQNESREKKGYEPPKVTLISLRPEEAVLGHCKNAGTGAPAAAAVRTLVPAPSQVPSSCSQKPHS